MFAYPYYQNPPMYAYSPEEYYHHSGNSEASYDSHYGYEDRPKPFRRRSSSIKKPLRRSKSFSKMEYEEDEYSNYYNPHLPEDNYYYQGRHRLDGVRSVSPFRENRNYHAQQQQHLNSRNEDAAAALATAGRRRNTWVQPTSFVNLGQPMINPMTHNYQMQQSLGMCATETWPGMTTNAYIPANNDLFYLPQNVPMIHQPYYLHPLTNNSNHPFIPATTSSVASSNASSFYPQQQQQQQQQQQTNLFPNFMPVPALFQELFSQPITMPTATADNQQVQDQEDTPKKAVTPTTSQKTSPIINSKEITTDHVVDTAHQKPPVTLRRKKSIMEGLLSSFALLGEEAVIHHAPMNTVVDQPAGDDNRTNLTWDPSSYTSLSEALHNNNNDTMTTSRKMSLSKKTSTRLSQKANALQNRQYIWCYRPYNDQKSNSNSSEVSQKPEEESPGLWAAFDMRNQNKLDQHYYFLAANNHSNTTTAAAVSVSVSDANKHKKLPEVVTDDPEHIVVLNKQASLPGPIMVSIHDHVAWYYNKDAAAAAQTSEEDFCLLEIACMPTVCNRLVVSNDLIKQEEEATKTLKRSKSMDGLASKLINTVLGW